MFSETTSRMSAASNATLGPGSSWLGPASCDWDDWGQRQNVIVVVCGSAAARRDHLYPRHYKSLTALLVRYASSYRWNQLPSSFWLSNPVHSHRGSPHPACITSSQSPNSLLPSITPSAFHSRLKTHLFHKSFPHSLSGSIWTAFTDLGLGPDLIWHWCLFLVSFLFLYFLFLATYASLTWSHSTFQSTFSSCIVP